MIKQTVKYKYGLTQHYGSSRMKNYPNISKLILKSFGYTNVGNYARSKVFIKLLHQLNIHKMDNILDLGAGLGEFSFMISEAVPDLKITSLEILDERIEILKNIKETGNFSNVEIFPKMIQDYPDNEHFDLIFSVDVFEHIYENEMPFKSCKEKLKIGGCLLVKIPSKDQSSIFPRSWFGEHNEWLEKEHVGQVYDLSELEKRFNEEGFEIVFSSYSDGWLSRLAWEIGYLSKKGGSLLQLIFLPICKLFIMLDNTIANKSSGNAIQVIGKKVS